MSGHLFIVHGDLTTIACDAILVPTDQRFHFTESWDSLELKKPEQDWGDEKVMQYRAQPKEPQIWLGNIGLHGDDNEFADYQPAVTEFVRQVKRKIPLNSDDRIYRWPKLRLALNVVGSGHGGAKERAGDQILGLVKLLRSLAARSGVDIILATYGDKPYAAAQRARRELLHRATVRRHLTTRGLETDWRFSSLAPGDLPEKAEKLAKMGIANHLVLFIGAGVSAGAGVPLWKDLLKQIARDGGVEDEYVNLLGEHDLRDWATLIDRKLASKNTIRESAVAVIREYPRCSLQHALLASLPSREAVTTNFDQLFEVASRVADRDLSVLPTHPSSASESWLLKLHGSVDKPSEMVLTRSDYLDMPRYRGALLGLVQGLLLTRHMMYVGYSLSDEDFHELVYEVRAARGTSGAGRATMLALKLDAARHDLWQEDVDIIAMTRPEIEKVDFAKAGRDLEIFLDLVGYLSTTSAAFFLDPTYRGLSGESPLYEQLNQLATSIKAPDLGSVAHEVDEFLSRLGAPHAKSTKRFTARITAADLDLGRIRIPKSAALLLPRKPGTIQIKLRDTTVDGTWNPHLNRRQCATLHLQESDKLAVLVGVGERLSITDMGSNVVFA